MEKGIPMSPSSPQGRFTRHARAVGVLWCVFTLCFTIIVAVVFIQPHWVGAASNSGPGHIGLWRWCSTVSLDRGSSPDDVICAGELLDIVDFSSVDASDGADDHRRLGVVNSTPFKAASLLVGGALLVSVLTIVAMSLFLCLKATSVFHLAGWMQIVAGCLLGAAVCVYPLGFSSSEARHLCGPTARHYNMGECNVRWAYVLAIIGVFDAVVLAALALVLATRTVKPQAVESIYATPDMYKGDFGGGPILADGASLAASRKSLNLQPVLMMPPPAPSEHDTYSHHYHSEHDTYSHHYHL